MILKIFLIFAEHVLSKTLPKATSENVVYLYSFKSSN